VDPFEEKDKIGLKEERRQMKRFLLGFLLAVFVVGSALPLYASTQKTIVLYIGNQTALVDDKQVQLDVPAFIKDGRTFLPIRFVAENLGAEVTYTTKADGTVDKVIVRMPNQLVPEPTPTPAPTPTPPAPVAPVGTDRSNPVPVGNSLITPDGFRITVLSFTPGDAAWNIIHEANQFNAPPASGMQYVLVVVNVWNVSSKTEPAWVSEASFALVGSSNKVFNTYDRSVCLPAEGNFRELAAQLYHGGQTTGAMAFYIPANESNLVLIWDTYSFNETDKRYFKVN